jgi:hypothetical protein
VTTSAPNRQGLKAFAFQTLYGTVETVPHKDFLVATQDLRTVRFWFVLLAQVRQAEARPTETHEERIT